MNQTIIIALGVAIAVVAIAIVVVIIKGKKDGSKESPSTPSAGNTFKESKTLETSKESEKPNLQTPKLHEKSPQQQQQTVQPESTPPAMNDLNKAQINTINTTPNLPENKPSIQQTLDKPMTQGPQQVPQQKVPIQQNQPLVTPQPLPNQNQIKNDLEKLKVSNPTPPKIVPNQPGVTNAAPSQPQPNVPLSPPNNTENTLSHTPPQQNPVNPQG